MRTTEFSMTLDTINDLAAAQRRVAELSYVTADQGGTYDVQCILPDGRLIARGRVGRALALVTRTGSVVTAGQVRVRIESLDDTGDRAGTLAVTGWGTRTGGVAPRYLFGL